MSSEPLTPENQEAVQTYRLLARQLVYDLQLGPALFDRFCGDLSVTALTDLLDRLDLIHESNQRAADNAKGPNS